VRASLYDAIQAERAKYPEGSRSAVLPALRLAQEEHGWLSPDVMREVADALEATPAFVASIATFYDQFNTEPVGEHLVEVCCGWGTIVAVDHRYHLHVRPDDTAAIVEELRGG